MKTLEYYGGNGYDNVPENGLFEVDATTKTPFTKLSEAIKFYNSLDEPKALWDLTTIPELLEAHQ